MSAKNVEFGRSNTLEYPVKSQEFFDESKFSQKYEFQIGVPQPSLTNDWWTTFTSISASENPLNPENERLIDDIPQYEDIHFLGGVFSESRPIRREVTVADDQTVVFPILTSGVDNVGWDFKFLPGYEHSPVPYQFSVEDLHFLADAVVDTAKRVSLKVNDTLLISDANKNQYRQASQEPYTLDLPYGDDILGYRSSYPNRWVKPPYTTGVQDGVWVQLDDLPLGDNTIQFTGTLDYGDIVLKDYNSSGIIGDTPLEFLLDSLQSTNYSFSLNITYSIDVVSRPEFNAQVGI